MASSSTTSPDTLITLKISHDGVAKKTRLPIRDLGASSLEDKLGAALLIAPGTKTIYERYSDSAGAYVTLDPSNVAVYKQLYRAAKAKQKLKLRVTTIEEESEVEDEPKNVPKPVTVEDVPETSEAPQVENVNRSEETLVEAPAPTPALQPSCARNAPSLLFQFAPQTQLNSQLSYLAKNQEEFEKNIAQLESQLAQVKAPPRWDNFKHQMAAPDEPTTVVEEAATTETEAPTLAPRATFAVCCNSCDRSIPHSHHYHCSTCEEGDFDLCQNCVDMGITCYGNDHWLIKRFVKNGVIINSTTERIAPKPKAKVTEPAPAPQAQAMPNTTRTVPVFARTFQNADRTCNNCVAEMAESEFVHCTTCYDFDLCKACFAKNDHGHHPKHGFIAAAEGTPLDYHVEKRLAPGRNQMHNAICDGCDNYIRGIRHKCLECPDWDYCSDCIDNAGFVHPDHRFVPIYEPIKDAGRCLRRSNHVGICCDGPLCSTIGKSEYIVGDRYKCAVCHDLDFCANCEASPANTHNKTHPLIKFKTAVRHVSVTTTGEHENGARMPTMGDRSRSASFQNRATETTATDHGLAFNKVQTNVSVEPVEATIPVKVEEPVVKEEVEKPEEKPEEDALEHPLAPAKVTPVEKLVAVYESDTVADGTVLPPNHVFEQTWVLRNEGSVAWPAGCSVKFVSGDYMGHVDPNHTAGISELVSASETTVCYNKLESGEEFPFTVLLRTPSRAGKAISYWRLTTQDGFKFGHRLWCDVDVRAPKPKEEAKPEMKEETPTAKVEESRMIFPKLEKESPVASIHEEMKVQSIPAKSEEEFDDFEESEDEWAEDDGFMTDEEYDILDASDEEYLEGQQKKLLKK